MRGVNETRRGSSSDFGAFPVPAVICTLRCVHQRFARIPKSHNLQKQTSSRMPSAEALRCGFMCTQITSPLESSQCAESAAEVACGLTVRASRIAASRASAVEGGGKQATATQRAYTPEGLIYAAKAGGERLQLLRSFRPTFVQNFLWCYGALKAAILRFQLRSASLVHPYLIEKKGQIKNPKKLGI